MHYQRVRSHGSTEDPVVVDTPSRFWAKVDKSGDCWLWTAGRATRGYGQFTVERRSVLAHRFSWTLANGPPGELFVCHTCDNPPCVNPAHLFLGTQLDNRRDCVAKGRTATGERQGTYTHPETRAFGDRNGLRLHPERAAMGERNGQAVLNATDVLEIRRLHTAGGVTQRGLAIQFGVSYSQIHLIVKRRKWKHI